MGLLVRCCGRVGVGNGKVWVVMALALVLFWRC